jgi:ABC-2 type transport system permease protein
MMKALLRAELLKQRSTRTSLGLFAAMLGLVLLAVLLHSFGLRGEDLLDPHVQLMVLGRGEFLGALFAALLGAMSITAEIRHGTIRPTFLFSPRRGRVIAAKASVSVLLGSGFGLVAGTVAVAAGLAALGARGIDVRLGGSDYVFLIVGSAAAAALWAAIGVGVGAVIRNQVPTLVGICAWLLFVEGLLAGDVAGGLGDVGRLLPGAAGAAISGQDPGTLLPPAAGLILLASYAAAAVLTGAFATCSRDVG